MKIEYFNCDKILPPEKGVSIAEFLHRELGRFGDPCDAIAKAIRYAMDPSADKGGCIAVVHDDERIVGAAVINRTGMEDYIPENILVYIAVRHSHRGRGVGKFLLSALLRQIDGDVALHVEATNPAANLYRSLGFESKYIEMRLLRKELRWLT